MPHGRLFSQEPKLADKAQNVVGKTAKGHNERIGGKFPAGQTNVPGQDLS